MIIMAIDLGRVRTGVAVSDPTARFAFPKEVITEPNPDRLVARLAKQARDLQAQLIVVGYPKNMDGSAGARAQECAELAERVSAASGIKHLLWDERCTTLSAHTLLNYTDTRGKKRKQTVDAVAAVIILEDYLKYREHSVQDRSDS